MTEILREKGIKRKYEPLQFTGNVFVIHILVVTQEVAVGQKLFSLLKYEYEVF